MTLEDIVRAAPAAALEDMLEAREARVRRQQALLAAHSLPLVCLTLNIPGPHKSHALAREAFAIARETLLAQLRRADASVRDSAETDAVTGFEGCYAVDADAGRLKNIAVAIEECHPIGRLFDLDVFDRDGSQRRGAELGRTERTCLICGGPVWACSRSRSHPVEQVALRAAGLIREHLDGRYADHVAAQATRALLYEVAVTPKPGLVDRHNNGAHRDMTAFTFIDSASVLTPYFRDLTRIGMAHEGEAATLLPVLRLPGQWAEERMFAATDGVNTHKGMIFSLGIFCAAAGYVRGRGEEVTETRLLDVCRTVAAGTPRELDSAERTTHGRRAYADYGLTGIRGEAAAGYPHVREHGYPVLRERIRRGDSVNDAGVAALLHLMAQVEDTNIVARSDLATLKRLRDELAALLAADPDMPALLAYARDLDQRLIRDNLSPGGSADLLALSFFLYFMLDGESAT